MLSAIISITIAPYTLRLNERTPDLQMTTCHKLKNGILFELTLFRKTKTPLTIHPEFEIKLW